MRSTDCHSSSKFWHTQREERIKRVLATTDGRTDRTPPRVVSDGAVCLILAGWAGPGRARPAWADPPSASATHRGHPPRQVLMKSVAGCVTCDWHRARCHGSAVWRASQDDVVTVHHHHHHSGVGVRLKVGDKYWEDWRDEVCGGAVPSPVEGLGLASRKKLISRQKLCNYEQVLVLFLYYSRKWGRIIPQSWKWGDLSPCPPCSDAYASSSWSGAPVKEQDCFHDTPPGGTISRTRTCCMEAKVEWLEISFDCS